MSRLLQLPLDIKNIIAQIEVNAWLYFALYNNTFYKECNMSKILYQLDNSDFVGTLLAPVLKKLYLGGRLPGFIVRSAKGTAFRINYALNKHIHILDTGRMEYYMNNQLHRDNLPAVTFANGNARWYNKGSLTKIKDNGIVRNVL